MTTIALKRWRWWFREYLIHLYWHLLLTWRGRKVWLSDLGRDLIDWKTDKLASWCRLFPCITHLVIDWLYQGFNHWLNGRTIKLWQSAIKLLNITKTKLIGTGEGHTAQRSLFSDWLLLCTVSLLIGSCSALHSLTSCGIVPTLLLIMCTKTNKWFVWYIWVHFALVYKMIIVTSI